MDVSIFVTSGHLRHQQSEATRPPPHPSRSLAALSTVNYVDEFWTGSEIRPALACARARAVDHRRPDAGAGHRCQRGDLQRRARRAPPPARQPRRGASDLRPPERARNRFGECRLLCSRDPGPEAARQEPLRVRRLLHDHLHDGWSGGTATGARGGRVRLLFRGDGAASRAGPPHHGRRRRSQCGRSCGADLPLLVDRAEERPDGGRQDDQARTAHGDGDRRSGTVSSVSG